MPNPNLNSRASIGGAPPVARALARSADANDHPDVHPEDRHAFAGESDEPDQRPAQSNAWKVTAATVLVGEGAVLDSLLLVTFLVAVEAQFAAEHGVHLELLDLLAEPGEEHGALKTIGTLTERLVTISGAVR